MIVMMRVFEAQLIDALMIDPTSSILTLEALMPSVAPKQLRNGFSHNALLKAVRKVPGFEVAEIATSRDGWYLVNQRVFTAEGELVHDDHRAWLLQEFVNDGASAPATHERLSQANFRLSRTSITHIILTVDRGGRESNFLQLEVEMHCERLDCKLMRAEWAPPRNASDLIDEAAGDPLPEAEQLVIGQPRYKLTRVVDIEGFLDRVQAIEDERRDRARRMSITVSGAASKQPKEIVSYGEIDPSFDKYPHKAVRFFQEWAKSSAGASGARLCSHWVMKTSEGAIPGTDQRDASLIPMWTTKFKLPEVHSRRGSPSELLVKLQAIDQKVGVPFAWFFFMLHGNRVKDGAGLRILKAAEAGEVEIPESDYQVLRRWCDRPYGF